MEFLTAHYPNADSNIQAMVKLCEEDIDLVRNLKPNTREKHDKADSLHRFLNMVDNEWKRHFRCNKDTFFFLVDKLRPYLNTEPQAKDVRLRVMAGLWYLANKATFRGVAQQMGISDATAYLCVTEALDGLNQMAPQFIRFPSNEEEYASTSKKFEEKTRFPGIVSCIDGSYIPFSYIPSESYINRKSTPSIILQATCDSDLIITSAYAGWPGRVHDARIYRRSNLAAKIASLPADYHVLGDAAYPCSSGLLTPYKGHNLTADQALYNYLQSSNRITIERTFALLKGRWTKLKSLDMNVERAPYVVIACCVLHNICIMRHDSFDSSTDVVPTLVAEDSESVTESQDGNVKRRRIAAMLAGR